MNPWRSMGIRLRLTLWALLLFGGGILIVLALREQVFSSTELSHLDRQASAYADYLLRDQEAWIADPSNDFPVLEELIARSDLQFRSFWFFLSDGEHVVYDNSVRYSVPPLLDSLYLRLPFGASGYRTVRFQGEDFRMYTRPTVNPQVRLTIVMRLQRLQTVLARGRELVFLSALILLAMVGISSWILLKKILRPVEDIAQLAEHITLSDIHQRVPLPEAEDELARLARNFNRMIDRLQEASQAQQRFVVDLAHDLRSPLTTLHLDLERMHGNVTEPVREKNVERAFRQVERLERYIADLLIQVKSRAGELRASFRTLSLKTLLADLAGDAQPRGQAGDITVETDLPEADILCSGDPTLLYRAINNLVDNALTHSQAGGGVLLRLSEENGYAVLEVKDTGVGMTPEELSRVTERLWMGEASIGRGGNGIGLSIVKEIAELHGGRLEVRSHPGAGTSVMIFIPVR